MVLYQKHGNDLFVDADRFSRFAETRQKNLCRRDCDLADCRADPVSTERIRQQQTSVYLVRIYLRNCCKIPYGRQETDCLPRSTQNRCGRSSPLCLFLYRIFNVLDPLL